MVWKPFSYELERKYYAQNWPRHALPYAHVEPYLTCWMDPDSAFRGRSVLDIGAGECVYARLIATHFHPKRVIACDIFAERMLPTATANATSSLSFVAGDCFNLPFSNGTFDVVFGSLVLCQLPDLEKTVAEIKRVLTPKGTYVGIEPNVYNPVVLYRYLRGKGSPNQYLFRTRHLAVFREMRFGVKTVYFYGKRPRFKGPLLSTCLGILASK